MIDIDSWLRELDEEEDQDIKNNEEYQARLFEEYVLRGPDHQEERKRLYERYQAGEGPMESGAQERALPPLTCLILAGPTCPIILSGSRRISMKNLTGSGARG